MPKPFLDALLPLGWPEPALKGGWRPPHRKSPSRAPIGTGHRFKKFYKAECIRLLRPPSQSTAG